MASGRALTQRPQASSIQHHTRPTRLSSAHRAEYEIRDQVYCLRWDCPEDVVDPFVFVYRGGYLFVHRILQGVLLIIINNSEPNSEIKIKRL